MDDRSFRVTAAPHPLKVERRVTEMPEGLTVAEMIEVVQPDPVLRRHAMVFVRGHVIPKDNWHRVKPKAGSHFEIRIVPEGGGGGGKNPLRIVLMIAVVVVATILGQYYVYPALASYGAGAAAAGAAFTTAAIPNTGPLVVNLDRRPA